jgi:pimeloyl-CoA synthetase
VGIIGSEGEALSVKRKISEFLANSLNLTLNEEKTLITHNTSYVLFLGYSIGYKEVTYKLKIKGTYRSARRRIITLMVDMNRVIRKLAEAKFCRKDGDP